MSANTETVAPGPEKITLEVRDHQGEVKVTFDISWILNGDTEQQLLEAMRDGINRNDSSRNYPAIAGWSARLIREQTHRTAFT